jgi:hypothetical protein
MRSNFMVNIDDRKIEDRHGVQRAEIQQISGDPTQTLINGTEVRLIPSETNQNEGRYMVMIRGVEEAIRDANLIQSQLETPQPNVPQLNNLVGRVAQYCQKLTQPQLRYFLSLVNVSDYKVGTQLSNLYPLLSRISSKQAIILVAMIGVQWVPIFLNHPGIHKIATRDGAQQSATVRQVADNISMCVAPPVQVLEAFKVSQQQGSKQGTGSSLVVVECMSRAQIAVGLSEELKLIGRTVSVYRTQPQLCSDIERKTIEKYQVLIKSLTEKIQTQPHTVFAKQLADLIASFGKELGGVAVNEHLLSTFGVDKRTPTLVSANDITYNMVVLQECLGNSFELNKYMAPATQSFNSRQIRENSMQPYVDPTSSGITMPGAIHLAYALSGWFWSPDVPLSRALAIVSDQSFGSPGFLKIVDQSLAAKAVELNDKLTIDLAIENQRKSTQNHLSINEEFHKLRLTNALQRLMDLPDEEFPRVLLPYGKNVLIQMTVASFLSRGNALTTLTKQAFQEYMGPDFKVYVYEYGAGNYRIPRIGGFSVLTDAHIQLLLLLLGKVPQFEYLLVDTNFKAKVVQILQGMGRLGPDLVQGDFTSFAVRGLVNYGTDTILGDIVQWMTGDGYEDWRIKTVVPTLDHNGSEFNFSNVTVQYVDLEILPQLKPYTPGKIPDANFNINQVSLPQIDSKAHNTNLPETGGAQPDSKAQEQIEPPNQTTPPPTTSTVRVMGNNPDIQLVQPQPSEAREFEQRVKRLYWETFGMDAHWKTLGVDGVGIPQFFNEYREKFREKYGRELNQKEWFQFGRHYTGVGTIPAWFGGTRDAFQKIDPPSTDPTTTEWDGKGWSVVENKDAVSGLLLSKIHASALARPQASLGAGARVPSGYIRMCRE